MGRPTGYTKKIADLICERLSEGESLRSICISEDMPNKATVFRWLNLHADFNDQYARAREEQAESLADEIISIADEASSPLLVEGIPLQDKNGNLIMVTDQASVAHAKLRTEARKWVASKLKPKKYGDKLELAGDKNNPLIHEVFIAPKVSKEEWLVLHFNQVQK